MDIGSFLIDIDGVLRLGGKSIQGAPEAVDFLKNNYRCLLVTNTTRYSLGELAENLQRMVLMYRKMICSPQDMQQ